jgi:hypothetical protein
MASAISIIPNFQANNLPLISETYAHFLPSLAIYDHCCCRAYGVWPAVSNNPANLEQESRRRPQFTPAESPGDSFPPHKTSALARIIFGGSD